MATLSTRAVASANLVHLRVAERARSALEGAGIGCLYLKGAAFLDTLYSDPSSRRLGDVDLLVPEPARCALDATLAHAGLTRVPPATTHPVSWATHYNWAYRSTAGTTVEVHASLCPDGLFAIDLPGMWRRAVVHRAAGRRIPTLSAEDSVLALAVHEAKHAYGAPAHSREDARRLIDAWRPDWGVVVDRATGWGARAACFVTLTAARVRGANVPAWVLRQLEPERLHRRLIERVVRVPEGRPQYAVDHPWVRAFAMMVVTDRWRERLRFVAAYARRRASDVVALAHGAGSAGERVDVHASGNA